MSSTRRISIAAGGLFILATITAVAAATLLPSLAGPDYLMGVANHAQQVTAAAILY